MFGRNSGETSLVAAYLAQTDRCVISEVPFNGERLAKMLRDAHDADIAEARYHGRRQSAGQQSPPRSGLGEHRYRGQRRLAIVCVL